MNYFGMSSAAFPWIYVDEVGDVIKHGNGALFSIPPDIQVPSVLSVAKSLSMGGWGVCPAGFALYKLPTHLVLGTNTLIFFGLKVREISTVHSKSEQLSIRASRNDIESYASIFLQGMQEIEEQHQILIRQSIHEIRAINSALYNTAYELEQILSSQMQKSSSNEQWLAKTVLALTEILRGRIDFMEFIANPDLDTANKGEIPVYRVVDKIHRCFQVTAQKLKINLSICGTSIAAVDGPRVFDLVPFLLIENAIKYSPDKDVKNCPATARSVNIVCNDAGSEVHFSVSSTGPLIEDGERDSIFRYSVRGKNAIKSQKSGSGYGLPVLKKIVEDVYRGEVAVMQQGDIYIFNDIPYLETIFTVKLPAHNPTGLGVLR
ncbi:MAG: HAMP domain-containing sensor histidine kinase [Sideroxydans sp.]|nr:HAMP domain-containing sensor histidine kinase [Sideroxydans sp.]